jgi:hypothetical protein
MVMGMPYISARNAGEKCNAVMGRVAGEGKISLLLIRRIIR